MRRRTFLSGSIAAAGGLAVGYRAWSNAFEKLAAALVARDGESLIGGWIKIGTDDWVTVYIPHVDMGQGVHTALAMLAAEELDADWSRVRAERAPADKAFANRFLAEGWVLQGRWVPGFLDGAVDIGFAETARFLNLQVTGGSIAVRFTGQVGMRVVGAAARAMLIEAAARRWGVAADALAAAQCAMAAVRERGRQGRQGAAGLPVAPRHHRDRPLQGDDALHAGHAERACRIDAKEAPAMHRGGFHGGIEHDRQSHIDAVAGGALNLGGDVKPGRGGADQLELAPGLEARAGGDSQGRSLGGKLAVAGAAAACRVRDDASARRPSSPSRTARSPPDSAPRSTAPAMPRWPCAAPNQGASSKPPTASPTSITPPWSRSTLRLNTRMASSGCGRVSRTPLAARPSLPAGCVSARPT
jgi:hypothetical protein